MSDAAAAAPRVELWHGAGNTFALCEARRGVPSPDPAETCRRCGVDGFVLLTPTDGADAAVRFFNPDGAEAGACGNGLRCVAAALDSRAGRGEMRLRTAAGVRTATVLAAAGGAWSVRVSMGEPRFPPPPADRRAFAGLLPSSAATGDSGRPGLAAFGPPILVDVGNPHAVLFLDRPATDELVGRLGPLFQTHPHFAATGGVNVGFAHVRSPSHVELRVYERGAGETAACGTGACAAVAAAVAVGRCVRRVTVTMPGGELLVDRPDRGELRLTGPAVRMRR